MPIAWKLKSGGDQLIGQAMLLAISQSSNELVGQTLTANAMSTSSAGEQTDSKVTANLRSGRRLLNGVSRKK